MKSIIIFSLFVPLSLLNSSFSFQNIQLKGLVCGSDGLFRTLKENYIKKDLYKQSREVNYNFGTHRIIDIKKGRLYKFEKYSNSFVPVTPSTWTYEDKKYGEVRGTMSSQKRGDNIDVTWKFYKNQNEILEKRNFESINLNDPSTSFTIKDGIKMKNKCEYFPIPWNIKIQKD